MADNQLSEIEKVREELSFYKALSTAFLGSVLTYAAQYQFGHQWEFPVALIGTLFFIVGVVGIARVAVKRLRRAS